jgi:hypothetical protein
VDVERERDADESRRGDRPITASDYSRMRGVSGRSTPPAAPARDFSPDAGQDVQQLVEHCPPDSLLLCGEGLGGGQDG